MSCCLLDWDADWLLLAGPLATVLGDDLLEVRQTITRDKQTDKTTRPERKVLLCLPLSESCSAKLEPGPKPCRSPLTQPESARTNHPFLLRLWATLTRGPNDGLAFALWLTLSRREQTTFF